MTMTELADRQAVPDMVRAGRTRKAWIAALLLALIVAGVLGAFAFVSRYAYARSVSNDGGGYSWAAPDNTSTTFVRLADRTGLVVPARLGHSQSFYFEIRNDSPVTQTILDLADGGVTAEPEVLAIATRTDYRLNESSFTYRAGPMALPPHSDRFARLTISTPACPGWSSLSWDRVRLRVRVGAFTRVETIKFSSTVFELSRTTPLC